ncbi:MAG TPA: SRPBCC family protein [Pseudonocardia sp.]|nr:SRPBCC family protein [Pseudonocardia sp.]
MVEVSTLPRGFAARTTTADPEAVWRRWTDPGTWGSWDLGLRSAALDGEFAPGAQGMITGTDGRRSRFTVREVEPLRRTVVAVRLPAAEMVLTRTLDPGPQAGVEHRVSFTGPLGALWSAVLGRRFRPLIGPTVERVAG